MSEAATPINYPELVDQAHGRIRKLEINLENVLIAATDYVRPCRACGVKLWFVRSVANGKLIPFTIDGTNHFSNCTDPARFKSKGTKS